MHSLSATLKSLSSAQLRELAIALESEARSRLATQPGPATKKVWQFDDRDGAGYKLSTKRAAIEGFDDRDALGYKKP